MRTVGQIIADLDTDPPEWWPMSRDEARLLAAALRESDERHRIRDAVLEGRDEMVAAARAEVEALRQENVRMHDSVVSMAEQVAALRITVYEAGEQILALRIRAERAEGLLRGLVTVGSWTPTHAEVRAFLAETGPQHEPEKQP